MGVGKSEHSIVPTKSGKRSPRDPVEGSELPGTEPLERNMSGTPSSRNVSIKLQRIAELARQMPQTALTSLSHHIDHEFLCEAYRRTRKDGASGVDLMTAEEYARNLEENLRSLLDRFKSGHYIAPPVRRVQIPKADGVTTRPIGIPTFEDKVLQRAVTMVVEAVYEQDFRNCSWGFRPGRSAHQALEVLREGLMAMKGGWVLEVDIRAFFDTLDHGRLRQMLDQRVRDGVLRRMIDKWLKAGVLEGGGVIHLELGTPQGGVISPLLANIYLHEVLDTWFETVVRPRMKGSSFLVRYADDAVIAFELESDARRVMDVLPKRFARFGLTLHSEKTRLVPFRRPSYRSGPKGKGGTQPPPSTFDLLGFTHYWARSRNRKWVIKRKTAKSRLRRAVGAVGAWCRRNLHLPVAEQHKRLEAKLRGHYQYFGITGNWHALLVFRREVLKVWRQWLDRRSQRARMWWTKYELLLRVYPLPWPVAVHSTYRRTANPYSKSRMR